jgi:molybdopterin synthase sulfur carrier subunit
LNIITSPKGINHLTFGLVLTSGYNESGRSGIQIMQVKLYASLRQAAGIKMMEVDIQLGTTIRDVLLEVTRRYPVLEKFVWKDQGELSELVHAFVNGENIRHLAGLETELTAEDHVDIFPPLVGG